MGTWTWFAAALFGLLVSGCSKPGLHPAPAREADIEKADVIVVLGYGPPVDKSGEPAAEIVRRVGKAVELYNAGMAPCMIMTGGNTYEDYYESAVMKEVAVKMGVPEDRVIEERRAMDTIGNARYSARIMAERGFDSCMVVSTPYHLKRARKLFEAAGVEVRTVGANLPDSLAYRAAATVYELLVGINYAFIDEEALVRGEGGDARTEKIKKGVRAKTRVSPDGP